MPKKRKKEKISLTEQQVLDLENLISMSGWAIIVGIMDRNIEALEESILEKEQFGISLTEKDVDRLRDKRGYLIELKETPSKYIAKIAREGTAPEEFDPYHTNAQDIINSRKTIAKVR